MRASSLHHVKDGGVSPEKIMICNKRNALPRMDHIMAGFSYVGYGYEMDRSFLRRAIMISNIITLIIHVIVIFPCIFLY